jgi:outer membrane lipoprotein carrier protein
MWGLTAAGAPSVDFVEGYFQSLKSLQADFVQTVYDEKAQAVQRSQGHMIMQKPGRFRWDYREPFEQVIVADGERLWLYDKELEQVTVRALDEALSATPLALLSGAAPLAKAFKVATVTSQDGLRWFELRPQAEQTEFSVLRVAFRGEALQVLELEDVFNQRTRLEFKRLLRNAEIAPARLHFVPPAGVDVVGEVP